jgi:hypothetical protein
MLAKSLAVLSLAVSLSLAVPAAAQDVWPVTGRLLGDDGHKSKDVSGIACATDAGFPRTCLVIDDNLQAAQIVLVEDGELIAGDTVKLIDDTFKKQVDGVMKDVPLELDGEAVAWDTATKAFYVVGSHGHPRDRRHKLVLPDAAPEIAARINASSRVIRVALDPASVDDEGRLKGGVKPDIKPSAMLRTLLSEQPALKPFMDKRLDKNGLTIEGAALRNQRLHVGLRGPILNETADPEKDEVAVFSVSLISLFEGGHADPQLKRLKLGPGRGIRDLVAVADGFLVLAGPSGDGEGLYTIYAWDGDKDLRRLKDLPKFTDADGDQIKPEGLLRLDNDATGARVLVLFDGGKEGEPRPFGVK